MIEISLERKNWNEVEAEVEIIMQNDRHIRWNNSYNM